jgi:integrase
MKLTPRNIAALKLPAGKLDHVEWDDDVAGFGLRLREGGSRTWVYRYRVGRTQKSIKLGNANSVPLGVARKNASLLEAEVRLGKDPAGQKAVAKQEAEYTFAVLAERFLDARRPELRPATIGEYERHLRTDAKSLHRLPISVVTQADIARLLNNAPGAVTANRLRSTLSAMFVWVMKEGVVLPRGNPAALTNKRAEQPRDRVLSNDELKSIWLALDNDDYGDIVKLLILTACRAEEIAGLLWWEVGDSAINLPGSRTKNKRAHTIPLSEPAKAIIADIGRGKRTHVFGRDDTGFFGWTKCKQRLDQKLGIPPWVTHDLRRTAVTGMAEIGVPPHIIEAVVNHVSGHKGGVAGIYNRATYDKEKREALNLWAEHVMALIEGRKAAVVPMRRGRDVQKRQAARHQR